MFRFEMGLKAKDKITGFTGIITGRVEYLYGCSQYGLNPEIDKDGKLKEIQYFDEGRIEIIGKGITAESVKADKNGPDKNRDCPIK